MSEQGTQNYENHVQIPKVFIVISLVVFAGVVLTLIGTFMLMSDAGLPMLLTLIGQLLLGVALLAAMVRLRQYSTKLQDRIIRTEMRLRLEKLGLGDKAANLSKGQLVGLRFESDAELPGLVEKVLAENIKSGGEIKKLVKDWQGDYDRV